MTPEQEIQALRAELARERARADGLQVSNAQLAEALKDAMGAHRVAAGAQERLEARRAADRERKRQARLAKLIPSPSADLLPGMSAECPRNVRGTPSFSSPPLDGSPLSSPDPNSPLSFILSPPHPSPLAGSPAHPPLAQLSDTSAEEVPEADPADVTEDSAPSPTAVPTWPPALQLAPNPPAAPESSREELRLSSPKAAKSARTRKPSAAEQLYSTLEATRRKRCAQAGVEFIPEDWTPSRQNTALGALARADEAAQQRLEAAWSEYLSDESGAARNPPWSLGWFLASKSTWESKALRAGGAT